MWRWDCTHGGPWVDQGHAYSCLIWSNTFMTNEVSIPVLKVRELDWDILVVIIGQQYSYMADSHESTLHDLVCIHSFKHDNKTRLAISFAGVPHCTHPTWKLLLLDFF